jgi:hypothetical protein
VSAPFCPKIAIDSMDSRDQTLFKNIQGTFAGVKQRLGAEESRLRGMDDQSTNRRPNFRANPHFLNFIEWAVISEYS